MIEFDDQYKEWDAAYVLGALNHDERKEYEAHLMQCSNCSAALALLAGIPGFLGKIDSQTAINLMDGASADSVFDPREESIFIQKLAKRVAQEQRKTRIRQTIGMVAAVVISITVGVASGDMVRYSPMEALNPSGNVINAAWNLTNFQPEIMTAELNITSNAWGTHFEWNCKYSKNAATWDSSKRYDMILTDSSGRKFVIASWTPSGDVAKGLSATTSLSESQIKMVEVTVTGSAKPIIVGLNT